MLLGAAVLAVAALVGVGKAVAWSERQYDVGVRAVELGYRDSDLQWLEPRIRPVIVGVVVADRDPVAVCSTSPTYAASVIAQSSGGWWVLLRQRDSVGGYAARVVWLSRDAYVIDLAPMAHQPDDGDGGGGTPNDDPAPWQQAACG